MIEKKVVGYLKMDDLKVQISENEVIGFEPHYLVHCWLCAEEFEVNTHETVRICNRCRKAWLKIRNKIENSFLKNEDYFIK